MGASGKLSKEEILGLYSGLFAGRRDIYGTYDPATGKVWQVKEPVTATVIWSHLKGEKPYGVYPLMKDRTRFVVADVDKEEPLIAREFVSAARHYGISAFVERSRKKGYHVWIWFEGQDGVPAMKARAVARFILQEIGEPETEVFPKQDSIQDNSASGNFINAPLFGPLVLKGRTAFVDETGSMSPYPDQWRFLMGIQRVSERQLDEVIELNELMPADKASQKVGGRHPESDRVPGPIGLPVCAQRMLSEGVVSNQRTSCFRLAVQLKKAGLPYDLAVVVLRAWAAKNRPENGARTITDREIQSQASDAYLKEYRSCGCEDPALARYCDSACLRHAKRPQTKTN